MERKANKIHFIGIGGIGVSALAKYYVLNGWQVTGSDLCSSEITESLRKLGAKIFIGRHRVKNLPKNAKLVIYSPAVSKNNPELKKAKRLKIKYLSYPEALGELTKKYFTIAISGTHGKSTTTAMIGLLLTKAGFNPTVIVGTKLKEFGNSNCRVGKSQYLVIEADEHFASFLRYFPKIIVLTRIEADHLDYFKSLKSYISAFKKFVSHLPPPPIDRCGGLQKDVDLVVNKDDKNTFHLTADKRKRTKFYSLRQREANKLRKVLEVPGEHNIYNALAALTVARILKIPDRISFKALSEYRGCWRRFEIIKRKPFTIISDYGHHPTEIKATLEAAREKYPKKKIWLVYQPHQYQRTYYLFKDFVRVFREVPADKIIITDIYDVAGRENKEIKKEVNSGKLAKAVDKNNTIYLGKKEIIKYLKKNVQGKDVVIIMGAGDIYLLTNFIK